MRHCLFNGITGSEVLTGLLSATQAERRRRNQPIGQDRETLSTGGTDSTSHPDAFVPVVVSLAGTPSMADDRVVLADWTPTRQEVQGDHPGSMLSVASGSAIKRITLRVKACRWTVLLRKFRSWGWAFTLPAKSVSKEKRILLCGRPRAPTQNIGRFKSTLTPQSCLRTAADGPINSEERHPGVGGGMVAANRHIVATRSKTRRRKP